jgi:hypothetical protein
MYIVCTKQGRLHHYGPIPTMDEAMNLAIQLEAFSPTIHPLYTPPQERCTCTGGNDCRCECNDCASQRMFPIHK